MSSPLYLLTDKDILCSSVKTISITATNFKIGDVTYKLFDIGDQRANASIVAGLLLLANTSEYGQVLYEDESMNRIQEALTTFNSKCNSQWPFIKTSIILFMNKTDLLAEKLPHAPLGGYFLDYQGRDNYDSACVYYLLYLFACRAEQIFCICVRYAVDYFYVCSIDAQPRWSIEAA